MSRANTARSRSAWFQVLLCVLDGLFLALLVVTAFLWLSDQLRFRKLSIGAVAWVSDALRSGVFRAPRFLASWEAGLLILFGELLALRYLIVRWARSRSVESRGLLAAAAVRKGLMSFLVVFAFFLLFESVLLLIGFEAPLPPLVMQGVEYQESHNEDEPIMADRDLIWKFKRCGTMHGQRINNIGFPERDVERVRKPGSVRVICMGDSCTADAVPPYSTMLHELLVDLPPTPQKWEAFHTAVHGYSVVQGLELFRKTTRALEPDVVTIYFGWNGHWNSGHSDRARLASLRAGLVAQIMRGLREKRFFQLMTLLLSPSSRTPGRASGEQVRVPPEDYRSTLGELVEEVRQSGAVPLLLTAPRAPKLSPILAQRGHGPTMEVIYRRHEQYADITRRVANECGVPLLDLAAMFENDPSSADLFFEDGIHLNRSGRLRVANAIYDKLVELYQRENKRGRGLGG